MKKNYISVLLLAVAGLLSFHPSAFGQVVPSAKPTASPTPTISATVAQKPVQTLAEIQNAIRERLSRPEVRRGNIGIKVVSLNTGKVVYEQDADKYFMPASNMKNFTVATAMERLGPDFKFVTSVYAPSPPDSNGVIHGDLRIYDRGDVSMSTSFDPAFPDQINHYRAIDMLVDRIAAGGIKRVEGDLVADESYFRGFAVPATWEWDDLQTYSGAEISAFPLNDNVVDISVKPSSVGAPCFVTVLPANSIVRLVNHCVTSGGGENSVNIRKTLNQNVVEINGSMPAGAKEVRESVTFTHMAELYIALLKERLAARGIMVTGITRTMSLESAPSNATVEITKLESPSFREIAAKTMKPSQNMYTETILWTLGEQLGRTNGASGDSAQLGLNVVKTFLGSIGIPADAVMQTDGSGLSRHDLITPNAVVALYTYMTKQSKNAQVWRDSLSIGGVDGTLRNRFKGTPAEGNIRGKTGTIDQVSALSGYMTTAGGESIVLSIIVNGVPGRSIVRTAVIDDIVVTLANFNGKIDLSASPN